MKPVATIIVRADHANRDASREDFHHGRIHAIAERAPTIRGPSSTMTTAASPALGMFVSIGVKNSNVIITMMLETTLEVQEILNLLLQ